MGAELCAWEDVYEHEVDAIRRRLAALSERTWTITRRLEDEAFLDSLAHVLDVVMSIRR